MNSERPRGGESLAHGRSGSDLLFFVALGSLMALAAVAGYFQVFSTYAEYDDEGYVMMSLVSYMSGKPLYSETYTQYGPALFAIEGAFHRLTGLPVSHDVTRLKTVVIWLLSSGLGAFFIFRLTANWRLGAAAFAIAFLHLERLCLEPGHPQEFCILGITLSLALCLPLTRGGRSSAIASIALGAVAAVLLMTKLNIGLFLAVGVGLTILSLGPRHFIANWLWRIGVAGAVVMPFALTADNVRDASGIALPLVVAVSVAMIGKVVAEKKIDPVFGWAPLLSFVAVAVGGSAAFAGWAVFEGTDLASLWHGLVGQHRGFGRSFYTPAPLYAAVAIWCFAIVDVVWNGRVTAGAILRLAFVSCFAFACLQHLPDTFNPLVHGLKDRGAAAALLGVGCPLLWLLLRPNWVLNANPGEAADETEVDVSDGDHVWTQRLPLCFIAALQPLAVYPTPGTQMAIGTIAIVFAAIVLLQDVVRRESRWLPRPALLTPALLLVAVSSLLVRDIHFAARYQQYTALNLPGAYRLRLPAEQVEQKRWLARTLSNTSTTFVFGEHACNSFYFWCRTQPPTALNPTFWPFLLTAQQQQRVIRALESKRDLAVIHQPFAVELPKDSPLLDYLDANFSLHTKRGQWQVWLRRDEDANR